jgi:predicted RecB family nuclease
MSYALTAIDGIPEDAAKALKACGIRTADKLLDAAKDARGRKALSVKTGIDEQSLLRWANARDRLRIKGIGKETAELLREVGVKTVRDLQHRNAQKLQQAIAAANRERKLLKSPPSVHKIAGFVEQARRLPLKITY